MFPNTLKKRENRAENIFVFHESMPFIHYSANCVNNTPFSIMGGIPWFVFKDGDHTRPLGSVTVTFCVQLLKLEVTHLYTWKKYTGKKMTCLFKLLSISLDPSVCINTRFQPPHMWQEVNKLLGINWQVIKQRSLLTDWSRTTFNWTVYYLIT